MHEIAYHMGVIAVCAVLWDLLTRARPSDMWAGNAVLPANLLWRIMPLALAFAAVLRLIAIFMENK